MKFHRVTLPIVLLMLTFCATAWAQDTGAMTGTVRDSSGAVVAGATVKITSTAGGNDRTLTTNSDGDYLAAGLPGDTYDITVTAPGFKTFKAKGVVLRVAQKARVDASLTVGQIATEVVVQGGQLNQVETQTSELAGTVTGKQITQLELNGRNFTQLVSLTPGTTNQSGSDEPGTGAATVAYSVNGGRTEYNNWEVDGANNLDDGSNTTMITYPSLDAIAEFRVLTSNYGAQYGKDGSGTVEVETKSGTSSFHGDAYEFNRNDYYNAKKAFQSSTPEYKKNDYGFTTGGPVFIPGHYNSAKTKTFFFWSEEWRKDIVPGVDFNVIVPSAAERGCPGATTNSGCAQALATAGAGAVGDFTDLCTISAPDCPSGFTNGSGQTLVPIDPNAVPLLAQISMPNTVDNAGFSRFIASPAQATDWHEHLIRGDQNFGSRLHLAMRYIHDSWSQLQATPTWTNGAAFPTIENTFVQPSTSLVARLTATASPTLLNEFVFAYSANHLVFGNVGAWQRPAGYDVGLFQNGFGGGKLPGISVGGGGIFNFAQDAGWVPNGPVNANPIYTYRDNVSKIVGTHNLQFGVYFLASEKNELPQAEPSVNGFLTYSSSDTTVSTGNAFADLLSGRIASFSQASSQPKYYLRHKIFEPYFQDDWHATPKLTLNLGLRISMFGTSRDAKLQADNFDPTKYVFGASSIKSEPGQPDDGSVVGNPFNGLVTCGKNGVPIGCYTGHLFNPAPRIGFAFDPRGDGKTAIRAGYGIFFEYTNGNEATATALEGSAPLVQTPNQSNIVGYTNIGAAGVSFPLAVTSLPQKATWPYVQQWHMDIQHEFARNTVAVLSYVGSKGTHLGRRWDMNQVFPISANQNPYVAARQPITGQLLNPDGTVKYAGDCATGTIGAGGPGITGYNNDGVPADQTLGTAGVNMWVACGNDPDFFRPFPGFSDIKRLDNAASSIYHGLQAQLRKTVGALQFGVAYTYSHSIDDSSSGGDTGFVNSYDLALNRASSNFDQRHVVAISYIYDMPFFKGKGLTHAVLGGWSWSGITSIQTGSPFTVINGGGGTLTTPSDNAGVANGVGFGSYPDLIGDPHSNIPVTPPGSSYGPAYGNPGAFVAPVGLTFGDAGRNILRNPTQTNFDMAVFKHIALGERVTFEFRAEAFNVFNHNEWGYIGGGGGSAANNSAITSGANTLSCYGGPSNSAGDPSCAGNGFLSPTSAHNARILQFGGKFIF